MASIFDEARSRIAAISPTPATNQTQNQSQNIFDQARYRVASGQTMNQNQIAPTGGSLVEKATASVSRQNERFEYPGEKAKESPGQKPSGSLARIDGIHDNTARRIDRLQNRMQANRQDDTAERIRSLEQQAINYSNAGMTEQMLQAQKELDALKQSPDQGKLDALKAQRAEEKAAAWQAEQDKRMQDYVNLQAEKDFSALAGQGMSADGWSKEELEKRISETDMEISKLIASGQFEEADNKKKELDSLYKMRSMGKYGEDAERDTYSYLLAKDAQTGGNEAQEYLKFMENTMNYRQGKEQAEKIQGIESDALRTLAIGAHSVASGMANAGAGYNQLLNGDEPIATSPMQYASQEIQEDLGKVGKLLYGAGSSVGNMLPSIVLSAATGGIGASAAVAGGIGAAAMGASSAGNAYTQAVKEGYSPEQAKTYAALVGASEATLQYVLGGISKLGGVTDDALLAKVSKLDNALAKVAMTGAVKLGSEIGEEELQLYLEPLIKSVVFGEEYKKPGFDEVLETALVTALSTGALEGKVILSAGKNTNAAQQTQTNTPNEDMVAKMAQDIVGNKNAPAMEAEAESTSVNTDPEQHTPQEQAIIEEYQSQSDEALRETFESYLQNPKKEFSRHNISNVSTKQAQDAGEILGGSYSGYKNAINSNGIRHILNEHGPNGTVDQSLGDLNDISRIGYVLDNYDNVELVTYDSGDADYSAEFRTKDNRPAPMLKYSKKVNGTYYVVEAIPESKYKKFWVVSAYMEKAADGTQAPNANGPGNTPNASLASSTAATDYSMHANTENVNGSVGAADYGFSPYSNYQNTQSDFLPEGANAARPVDMPATDPMGRPVSRVASNLYGAQITTDDRRVQMELEFMQGAYGYDKKTNDAAVSLATETIKRDGYDKTYGRVTERLRDLKDLKQTMTEAILLYNDAIRNGNEADAAELALLMTATGPEAGQLVQSFSMFRQLTPEGQLMGVQRIADKLNEKVYGSGNGKGKRKGGNPIPKYQQTSVENEIDDVRETALRLLENIHDALSDSDTERKHGVPVEDWMTKIGKQLAQTIGATPSDPKPKPISKIIKQDLLRFAKDYLPKKKSAPSRTAADTLTDFFANREQYVEAWNAAKEAYRAKHGDDADFSSATITFNGIGTDPVMVQAIVDEVTSQELKKQKIDLLSYLGDQASLEKQISDGLINRTGATGTDADMIRQAVTRYLNETRLDANIERIGKGLDSDIQKVLKSTGSSMYSVIRDSKGNKGAAAKIISNMMVKQYGISKDAAKTASAKIVERFNNLIAQQTKKTLDSMFAEHEKGTPKSAVQKITEMGNLGAFEDSRYRDEASKRADNWVTSDIKKNVKSIGLETAEIIRSSKEDKAATANQIKEMLMKNHRLVGEDAKKMADFILDRFNSYVAERSESALKQRFGEKDKKQKKTFEQDFTELANMGAFTNANWKDAVSQKLFGHEITIDPTLVEEFRNAPDQQTRDAVMEKIYENVGEQIPTTFGEAASQWRYTAMLLSPSTHIKNMGGNLSMMLMKMGKDAVGTGIETVANAATKGKAGRTKSILNVFSKNDQQLMQTAWADFENVKDDVAGIGKNKDNVMGKIGEHRDYWKLNNPETKVAKALDATLRAAETIPKLNSKAMDIEDQIFSQPDYALSLAGYMKANKLTEITPEARLYAIKEAQKATFRDANAVSDFAKRMGNTNSKLWNGIVNAIFPFKGTPANVGVRAVEYSPAGFLTTIGKAIKASRDGTFKATDFIDDLSANLVGTALAAAGYFLAQNGWLRATGIGDEKEKEAQREAGYKDNSFILFGYSVPETVFTSASTPMFVGAALYEALATKALDGEAYTIDDVLQAMAATTDPLVGQSMLDGLNDTLYATRSTQGGVGEWGVNMLVNITGNYIASYIPTLVSRLSSAADGVSRETYADKNKPLPKVQKEIQDLMMKTPLRTKLPEKVDNYGRVQENWLSDSDTQIGKALGAVANVVTPTFPSKIQTTDVEAALQDIYRSGADTDGKKIFQTDAPKSIKVDGKNVNLTAEQYEKLEKNRGEMTMNYQAGLQDNDVFAGLPNDMKVSATDKMFDYIEQRSKAELGIGYKPENWVSDLRNASPKTVAETIVEKAAESMAESGAYENKYDGLSNLLADGSINDKVALAVMSDTAVDSYNAYCKDAGVSVQQYAEVHGYMNKVKDLDATLKQIDKMIMPKAKRVALAQAVAAANPKIIRLDNPVSEDWLLKHGATDAIVDQFSLPRRKLYTEYIKDSDIEMGDYLDIYNYRYDDHKQAEVIAEIDKLNYSNEDKIKLFLAMDYSAKKIPNWWK